MPQKRLHRGVGTTITALGDPVVLVQKTLSTWWQSKDKGLKKDHSYMSERIMTVSRHQGVQGTSLVEEEEGEDTSPNSSGSAPGPLQTWVYKTLGPADALAWISTPGMIMMTMTGAPLAHHPQNQRMKVTSWVNRYPGPSSCATSATRSWSTSITTQEWEDPTVVGSYTPANAEKARTALSLNILTFAHYITF